VWTHWKLLDLRVMQEILMMAIYVEIQQLVEKF
jgi:hypothetical protein